MVEVQARMAISSRLENVKAAIEAANGMSVDYVTEMAHKR